MYKGQKRVLTKMIGLLLLAVSFFYCNSPSTVPSQNSGITVDDFQNILNLKGVPDSALDRSIFAFSDLGAWFAYALPADDDKTHRGSFIGPYIMTQDNGIWISDCLAKMEIKNVKSGKTINLRNATLIENIAFPNRLQQTFQTISPVLLIQTQLIFVSNRTAVIKVMIQNKNDDSNLELAVAWRGNSFLKDVTFTPDPKGVRIGFGKNKNIGWISTDTQNQSEAFIRDENYRIQSATKVLAVGESWETYLTQSFCFTEKESNLETLKRMQFYMYPDLAFSDHEKRWNESIQAITTNLHPKFNSKAHQKIAVKCLQTLNGNWKSAAGFLKHDGLFPSYNYEWFNGFWSWDSWKHAVAIAPFNGELAKNQIRAMFDFQDDLGMIADCVYRDTIIENHNWRDTKPPLSAWAVWNVFQHTHDQKFLQEVLPKIEKYHNWWYKYRDIDKNGLCEYGSTDGSLIAAKWESGMDNAVRFDNAKIIKNKDGSGSMDRESVDLNAYLFAEKNYLAKIRDQLGQMDQSIKYNMEAEALKRKIQQFFYDEESAWFYDIDITSKKHLKTMGSEGWIPLWAHAATVEQAASIRENILDTTKFSTYIPFPTLAADHPKFKPQNGYWRGPVWLDQAYFGIQGLRNYGYESDAIQFSNQLFDRLKGLKNNDLPIRENYNPLTGEGLESHHFSWSAAHLLMLLMDNTKK